MEDRLSGKTVAVLATDGFEESELIEPVKRLREAGARVEIVSIPRSEQRIRGWKDGNWSTHVDVDTTVGETDPARYEALVLPGGVMNPDKLRMDEDAVEFVRGFFEAGKPVAAICHGPWLLAEADVLDGRTVTSWPSLRTDLENAGATWVDREVVVDQGLVTSRNPSDLPAFTDKMVEEFVEGVHAGQQT
ncbi:MAG: type 1 glutamine amidotransferase [Gemmatimonadetes bacterium]|nr:type 1 glutamine amidotransferase [Gemmatimonadota bacterium]